MGEPVQAIETFYDGYRFRSRLEARWAVFFHEAGIQYEYEPEGFNLPNCGYYLPDFYLPMFGAYVEVKPLSISHEDEETAKEKLIELFYGIDGITILLKGDPVDMNIQLYANDANDSNGGEGWWTSKENCVRFMFIDYGSFGCPCIYYYNIHDHILYNSDWSIRENVYNGYMTPNDFYPMTKEALKARQARFEHGEYPGVVNQ